MTSKKLSVAERFILMQLLPDEGNFATMKMLRDLLDKVGFTAEEHADYGFESVPGEGGRARIRWNPEKAKDRDFDFSDPQVAMVIEALAKLDREKKLTAAHLTLCEKFDYASK